MGQIGHKSLPGAEKREAVKEELAYAQPERA